MSLIEEFDGTIETTDMIIGYLNNLVKREDSKLKVSLVEQKNIYEFSYNYNNSDIVFTIELSEICGYVLNNLKPNSYISGMVENYISEKFKRTIVDYLSR